MHAGVGRIVSNLEERLVLNGLIRCPSQYLRQSYILENEREVAIVYIYCSMSPHSPQLDLCRAVQRT